MSEPESMLRALAETAVQHAQQMHGLVLDGSSSSLADADRAMLIGRQPDQITELATCYGAYLGEIAVRELEARWIGLGETQAPRLRVGGRPASPIDAARRRLTEPNHAAALPDLFDRMQAWVAECAADRAVSLDRNRSAWDARSDDERFAGASSLPPDRAAAQAALDPWVAEAGVENRDVLCLAAGGGRHGPLHALAGGRVTVVDLSVEQLAHDQSAAEALGLDLNLVQGSIDDLSMLEAGSFDRVIQPVSACYLPNVRKIYREVARVLRSGGLYVVQHKQPAMLQADAIWGHGYRVNQAQIEGQALADDGSGPHRESGTSEYLHTLEALVGGLCEAGFVIESLREPPLADALAPEGHPAHRALFLPPYLMLKARRV